jgi:NTE family protein
MKQIIKYSFRIVFLFFCHVVYAQNDKPKVALVLSGGGAKGIAHIPVLQALDSLGIVPDIVIGTSMGSIVGALYSMGYSGDSIAAISNSVKWSKLFGSEVSINAVSNEEKSEFKRYLIELELINGLPKKKTAIINDQNLRAFFNEITYPVYDIKDFDDLPIPFRAIAVDIVHGKEVALDKGSLVFAMRSSMSIPAVFSPMEYQDALLVDGGVLNNFPTDVAKAWGADIIIGSDVGGGMQPKDKLDNISALVFQTGMLASNLKIPANRALCDVLIDHTTYLTYSTGSFGENVAILNEGKIGTQVHLSELVALAKQLKPFPQKQPKLPKIPNKLEFDTIRYNGIGKDNLDLFKARTNIEPNTLYAMSEIMAASHNAFGTNLFEAVSFELFNTDENLGLEIKAKEKSSHLFKGALHYDSYQEVGLFVNYTGRNVIGNSSRLLVSLDITKDLRYRLQYQKHIGVQKRWWYRSEFYGQNLNQQTFISGKQSDDVNYNYYQFDNQFNFNIDSFKSYVGFGVNYEWNTLKPKIDPTISDNAFGVKRYDFETLDIYVQYVYHSMDKAFYANRGTYFQAKLGTSLYNEVDTQYLDDLNIPSVSGKVSDFTKFSLHFEKRIPLNPHVVAIIGASTGYTFYDDENSSANSFGDFGYAAKYFLGGNIVRPRKDNFILPGLKEDELAVTQFTMINMAAQFRPMEKVYLTPHVNLGSVGFDDFDTYSNGFFSPNGRWDEDRTTSFLVTAGVTASYNSILGPIDFDVSWVNNVSKIRLFLGVGYHFNRSN